MSSISVVYEAAYTYCCKVSLPRLMPRSGLLTEIRSTCSVYLPLERGNSGFSVLSNSSMAVVIQSLSISLEIDDERERVKDRKDEACWLTNIPPACTPVSAIGCDYKLWLNIVEGRRQSLTVGQLGLFKYKIGIRCLNSIRGSVHS